jgi:hypothetical protein
MADEHEMSNSVGRSFKLNNAVAVILVLLVLIIVFGAGIFIGHRRHTNIVVRSNSYNFRPGLGEYGGGFGFNSLAASSRITGAVTAINGSTLTVIGNGTTYTVTTTSATKYANNVMPSVDDTITILGGQGSSSSSFTASAIVVMNH